MINKSVFVGRLVDNINLYQNENATVSAKFTLAVNRKGDYEKADFIPFIAFGKTAEFLDKLTQKGSVVAVEGHWQSGRYKDKENKTVYSLDCVVDSFEVIDKKVKLNQE